MSTEPVLKKYRVRYEYRVKFRVDVEAPDAESALLTTQEEADERAAQNLSCYDATVEEI